MKLSQMPIHEAIAIKKSLGLPIKAALIYISIKGKSFIVVDMEIVKKYDTWSELKIYLQNGHIEIIHSAYFAEMQREKRKCTKETYKEDALF
jgi:hypothetical protein